MMKRDVIVIGGGAGAREATKILSHLGLQVTLFERQSPPGIPIQPLIQTAKLAHDIRHARDFGLQLQNDQVNTQHVIQQVQAHDDRKHQDSLTAEVLKLSPKFIHANEIQCGDEHYTAKRVVIATGSTPIVPEIPGLDQVQYLTTDTIFSLPTVPKRLLMLGSEPVGIELAQAMQRLGSKVTIIESSSRLFKNMDLDIVKIIQDNLESEGINFVFDHEVESIEEKDYEITLHLLDPVNESRQKLTGDTLLVATGRKPNIAGLGLDAADIATVSQGICVDARLRTSQKSIYAIGDVAAISDKSIHVADCHARIAAENIAYRWPVSVNVLAIPRVLHTDPEIANVGLSEHQAELLNQPYEVHEQSYHSGKLKYLLHKGKLLGATIIGARAGEWIAEFVLVMQGKLDMKSMTVLLNQDEANRYSRRFVMCLNKCLP